MDTMDRIPCCSVIMYIKYVKLGQGTDHICGIKQKITYRHWPSNNGYYVYYVTTVTTRYYGDDILSGISTFLSIVLRIQLMRKSFCHETFSNKKHCPRIIFFFFFFWGGGVF